MSVSKFRGIIIKDFPVGESDKYLTFYTKEYGKFFARARGARNIKSKYLAGSHVFTYGDFVVYSGRNFNSITQIDIIENFYDIRMDYEKFAFGAYILEIVDKSTFEDSPNEDILKLLLRTFQYLNKGDMENRLLLGIFIFKYLELSGYIPEILECVICGGDLDKDNMYFGLEGTVCYDCKTEYTIRINFTVIYTINYIINSPIKDIFDFKLEENILNEFYIASKIFLNNLELNLKGEELIKEFEN